MRQIKGERDEDFRGYFILVGSSERGWCHR